jgi:hypothetical protein
MKRRVLDEVKLYGDLHRFVPILADKYGFKIKEIKAKQRKEDTAIRLLRSGAYLRRLLDMLTVLFITKFTMKPLRFFGLIGTALFGVGGIVSDIQASGIWRDCRHASFAFRGYINGFRCSDIIYWPTRRDNNIYPCQKC